MSGPRLARGTLYNMTARGIFLGCDFIIHVYFARTLGPEAYGICGVLLALLAIISQPLNIGLSQSVSKYVAEDQNRARTILHKGIQTQLVIVAFLMILFIGSSGTVSSLLKSPVLDRYMVHAAIILPALGIFTILLGLFNGMRSFGREALVLSSYPITRTLAVVTLIYFGYNIDGVIWGFIIGICLSVLLAFLLFRAPDERVAFEGRKLRTFAVPVFVLGLVMIIVPNIDLFFVKGIMVDEKETGIYNSARVLARASYFFFLALGSTLFPSISESVSMNDDVRTASYIKQSVRYLLMMSLPVACLVSAYGTDLVSLVFSGSYSSSGPALSVLMFGFTFLTLFSILTTILMAGGWPKHAMMLGIMLLPVDALLNYVLITRYDLLGAAFATSLTAVFGVFVASIIVIRTFGAHWEIGSFCKIGFAAGTIYLLATYFSPPAIWKAPWIVLLVGCYGVILYLTGELQQEDWIRLKRIVMMSSGLSGLKGSGA